MKQNICVTHYCNYNRCIDRAEYHKHPYDEMLLILSGDIVAFTKNSYFSHQGSCILFYKKNCEHCQINGMDTLYDRFYFNFDRQDIYDIFPDSSMTLEYAETDAFLIPLAEKEAEKLKKCSEMMIELYISLTKNSTDLRLKLLFGYLFAEITEISQNHTVTHIKENEPYIASVLRYISANITEKLIIDTVAEKFSVGRSKLTHDFNSHLSMTFNEYVTMERINRARTMLLDGEKLNDISEKCGFYDSTYFIRVFKKNINMTPTEYRRKYNASNNFMY